MPAALTWLGAEEYSSVRNPYHVLVVEARVTR